MRENLIETKNLTFSYEKAKVLEGVSLSVGRGEKIAVMGPNGAGKSTFFLILNGVLTPQSGEMMLRGREIKKKDSALLRKKIGFVFQDADSQMVASNVRAEISFGPMNLRIPRQEVKRRVDEAVAYMELEELQERAPHYLSGGEKKRVSIADILAMEPEILMFDEPMAALDPVNAEHVEQILQRLHGEGKTLLVATHDVDFAYRFADRILILVRGSLIADGSPADVFHREEVLERAHLKKPAVMAIWEALEEKKLVLPGDFPASPQEAVERILGEPGRKEGVDKKEGRL